MASATATLSQRIARVATLALLVSALAATSASATVSFDTSFGNGGTSYKSGFPYVLGSTLDAEGRILVAGSPAYMFQTFGVARFSANGKPDNTFGSGGIIADAIPGSDLPGYLQAHSTDVAAQPDGKIVLVGTYQTGGIETQVAVVRLNSNGSTDSDFGDGGRVLIPVQTGASANAVQLASNGDIVIAGSAYSPDNVIAIRLDSNGDPVNSFGGDGVAATDLAAGGSGNLSTGDVLIDGDGVIAVGARNGQMALTRFKANGDLDGSFGSGGLATSEFPQYAWGQRATRLADGRIMVAGGSGSNIAVTRFLSTGELDSSYGFGGMLTAGFVSGSSGHDVVVRPNGKIIVAGSQGDPSTGPQTIAMLGTTSTGQGDPAFGDNGRVTTQLPLTSVSEAQTAQLDSQGRLLVIGSAAGSGIGMARYLVNDDVPDPASPPRVSLDADFPSAIKASKLNKLDGDLGGSAAKVQVALRLNLSKHQKAATASKSASRCQWLKTAKAKFSRVKSSCEKQLWLRATISPNGHWKLALKKKLPKGKYTVFVRALDSAGKSTAQLTKPLKIK